MYGILCGEAKKGHDMKVNEPPPVQPKRIVGRGRAVPPAEQAGGSGGGGSHDEPAPDQDSAAVQGGVAKGIPPA